MTPQVWEVVGSGPGCQNRCRSDDIKLIHNQGGGSSVAVMAVSVDTEELTCPAVTLKCGGQQLRSTVCYWYRTLASINNIDTNLTFK